jgi:hypothetical protein
MPLFDLFVPYPIRKQLLRNLSAYDIAIVDVVLGKLLDSNEREYYLNPLRDLVWDLAEIQSLEAYGMKLLLIGNDVLALQRRLQQPQYYIRKYGHNRKLQIYLVGYCPVMIKTTGIRDRLIRFSLFGAPNAHSIFEDTNEMRCMKARVISGTLNTNAIFIMSFGASAQANERRGFWLHVPIIPDLTIDLRVYIPSSHDRMWEEIRFPCREALRLSRCVLRRAWLLSYFIDILCMCLNIHAGSVAYLTSSGVQSVRPYEFFWLQRQIDIQLI